MVNWNSLIARKDWKVGYWNTSFGHQRTAISEDPTIITMGFTIRSQLITAIATALRAALTRLIAVATIGNFRGAKISNNRNKINSGILVEALITVAQPLLLPPPLLVTRSISVVFSLHK